MSPFPEARFTRSAVSPGAFGDDSGAEIAFAGRSNSGKSSALNVLVGRRGLARTSRTPGRTQAVNFFELEPGLRVADLPGYGFAKVPAAVRASWAPLMESYFSARASLCAVVLVVDARRGIGPDDETLLGFAEARRLPVHVLLAKCDKLTRSEGRRQLLNAQSKLAGRAKVQLFSAETREGVEAARAALEALARANRGQKNTRRSGGPPGDTRLGDAIRVTRSGREAGSALRRSKS